VNQGPPVGELPRFVEQRRNRIAGSEFLNSRGSEKTLADGTLRININNQHTVAEFRIRTRQMKAGRALSHSAFLVDQAERLRWLERRLPLAILRNLPITLVIWLLLWRNVGVEDFHVVARFAMLFPTRAKSHGPPVILELPLAILCKSSKSFHKFEFLPVKV